MNPNKIIRLRKVLEALRLRSANMPSKKLENLAKQLGRRPAKRGSEPNWISDIFPSHRPVSIPHHSKALKRFTAENIIDRLEEDLIALEEIIKRKEIMQ